MCRVRRERVVLAVVKGDEGSKGVFLGLRDASVRMRADTDVAAHQRIVNLYFLICTRQPVILQVRPAVQIDRRDRLHIRLSPFPTTPRHLTLDQFEHLELHHGLVGAQHAFEDLLYRER